MLPRRSILLVRAAAVFAAIAPARAFTFQPYDGDAVSKAIKSGKPVNVRVYALSRLRRHAQGAILFGLEGDTKYDAISFFRIDYDRQKEVVAALACPRSTLIAYKGGKEIARMSWGVMQDGVVKVLQAVL